jgi:hypothetical protein
MARFTFACICAALLCMIAAAANVSAQSPPPAVSLPPPNLDANAGKFSGFNESAYKCVAVLAILLWAQDMAWSVWLR